MTEIPKEAMRLDTIGRQLGIDGEFEVYSIASGKKASKSMSWDEAWDEMKAMADANGTGNGLDVRRVKKGKS